MVMIERSPLVRRPEVVRSRAADHPLRDSCVLEPLACGELPSADRLNSTSSKGSSMERSPPRLLKICHMGD